MRSTPTMPLLWSTDQATYTASGDLAQAALYSQPIPIDNEEGFAAVLKVASGTAPTGTFKVQTSNHSPPVPPTGTPDATAMDWADTSASAAITTNGNALLQHAPAYGRWVRVTWTKTSGTGTLTGNGQAKGAH